MQILEGVIHLTLKKKLCFCVFGLDKMILGQVNAKTEFLCTLKSKSDFFACLGKQNVNFHQKNLNTQGTGSWV